MLRRLASLPVRSLLREYPEQEVDTFCQRAAKNAFFSAAEIYLAFLTLSISDSYGKIKVGFAHIEAGSTGAVCECEALCCCLDGRQGHG